MKNRKILIVDDSRTNLDLMQRYLEEEGYEVLAVQQPREVITEVQRYKPDAIVMDILMPGIKGDEIAKELKADPGTQKIPVILITADLLQEENGLAADYFVRRPVIGDELIETLDRLFEERR